MRASYGRPSHEGRELKLLKSVSIVLGMVAPRTRGVN